MISARLEVVREERARKAVQVLGIIQGYRAKRLTSEDCRRIVKEIAGEDLMKVERTEEMEECLRESRERARLAREGKAWQR